MGVGKTNTPTEVKVDSGVKVLGGVDVKGAVEVKTGKAATVCVDAATAVCMIKVLIALGSSVDADVGAAMVGTHAMINTKMISHSNILFLGDCMFIH